jgi:hypothetical protein
LSSFRAAPAREDLVIHFSFFFFSSTIKNNNFSERTKKKESEQNVSNEFLGRPQKMKNKII